MQTNTDYVDVTGATHVISELLNMILDNARAESLLKTFLIICK